MASLNKVMLIGALGADPEVRSFQSGGRVCNMRMATSERWKDKNGDKQERTEWHSVVVYGDGLVGVCERYLRKGSKVYIEGKIATRKWKDRDGNDRYSTEIIASNMTMLDGAKSDDRGERKRSHDDRDDTHGQVGGGGYDDLDDEIPF